MSQFETRTPDGWRQLAPSLKYFRLETKQILDETGWAQDSTVGVAGLVDSRTVFVAGPSLADTPIVALSCAAGTHTSVVDAAGGVNVTVYRIKRTVPSTVTLYVFSRRRPPDPGRGLAFYDAGGITFSILSPLVKPLGTIDNAGYVGLSTSGKSCAHIPQRRGHALYRDFRIGNLGSCSYTGPSGSQVQGYQSYYTDSARVWFVACSGASVVVDSSLAPGNEVPFQCNPGFTGTPQQSKYEQNQYRSLVIDVTNI